GNVLEKAVLVVLALILVWLTVRLDGKQKHRIFPTGVLSMRAAVGAGFWIQALIFVTVTTTQTFMPLVLNGVYGVTPLWIGGVTTIFSFGWTAGSLWIAGRSPKLQEASMAGGMAIAAVSLAAL